jgi:hypothetical protein
MTNATSVSDVEKLSRFLWLEDGGIAR